MEEEEGEGEDEYDGGGRFRMHALYDYEEDYEDDITDDYYTTTAVSPRAAPATTTALSARHVFPVIPFVGVVWFFYCMLSWNPDICGDDSFTPDDATTPAKGGVDNSAADDKKTAAAAFRTGFSTDEAGDDALPPPPSVDGYPGALYDDSVEDLLAAAFPDAADRDPSKPIENPFTQPGVPLLPDHLRVGPHPGAFRDEFE